MCPDKKMITSYIDDILDNDCRNILEKHFLICPECRLKVQQQKAVKDRMNSVSMEKDINSVQDKVWEKIRNYVPESTKRERNFKTVPFPMFAAAAGLLIIFAAGFFITNGTAKIKSIPTQTVEIGDTMLEEVKNYLYDSSTQTEAEENMTFRISEKELEQLINLLSSNSAELEVTLSLPSEPSFDIIGKPEIIKGDEYRRYQK